MSDEQFNMDEDTSREPQPYQLVTPNRQRARRRLHSPRAEGDLPLSAGGNAQQLLDDARVL